MKFLILALMLATTSAFAQKVEVSLKVVELKGLKKTYKKIKTSDGLPALETRSGGIVSPGLPATYENQYTGFRSASDEVTHPTAIEYDCLTKLRAEFIAARKELKYLTVDALSALGIASVKLIVYSDLDKKLDNEVIDTLIENTGLNGRELTQIALLKGTTCLVQTKNDIKKSLKSR